MITYKWGEEIKICSGGKPCYPKPIENVILVHDFGDREIFSFDINFVCAIIPCMFSIGASINMAIYAGVSGVLGVPEALDFEKKLWGEENLKVVFLLLHLESYSTCTSACDENLHNI